MGDFLTLDVIIPGAVMVASFVGMLMCAKKQRTNPRAQLYAIGLLIVVIACGGVIMVKTMGSGDTQKLIANELAYAKATAIILGKNLAIDYSGSKALIIADQNWEKNKRQKILIDGLKEGFGSGITVGAIDAPMPENAQQGPEGMPMMMMEMMTAADFDAVIAKHPDCNLIVSLIGLPRDVGNMALWQQEEENRPKMALLFGEIYDKVNEIAAGALVACVSYRPGVKFSEEPAPEDPQEAFDKRYILITPKNVQEVAEKYPGLFQTDM